MKKTLHASRYLAFDFFASFIAWVLFYFLRKHLLDEQLYGGLDYKLFIGSIVIASIWTVIYFLTGAYYDVVRKSRIKEVFSLFANSLYLIGKKERRFPLNEGFCGIRGQKTMDKKINYPGKT